MAVLVDAAVERRPPENAAEHLLSQTVVLTRRLLIRSARNPMTLVHALLLPVAFLFTLKVVFGDSITSVTGENALYRSVPLVALLATMSGSTTGVVGITAERFDGFLARLWALPLHRAAGLLSRLAAETVRLVGTTLVILGTGMILGFRFHRGVAAALLWVAVPVIFGVAFSVLATTAALYWPKAVLVEAMQPVIILGCDLLHGVRAVGAVPGLGPAAGPVPADVTGRRRDARTVGGWAGAVADDRRTGVVCRHPRGVPVADHGGLPQGEHQPVTGAREMERGVHGVWLIADPLSDA